MREMTGKRINIGVLGCASVAGRLMIPTILEQGRLYRLAGIASRDGDKADAWAREFDTQAFRSYESLVDAGGLNAIYIPLPNALHAPWIEHALNKGLHVLVEKSLACSVGEVTSLNCAARDKGLALVENFQFRFHSQLAEIERMVDNGVIGELRCVRSSFGFPPFPDPDNIRYRKDLGGGALLDAGAYPIKISQIFLGADLEVKAASFCIDEQRRVDIWGGGFLRQKNGPLFSEIAFGFDHHYQCSLELWGSRGKLSANRIFTAPPGFRPEVVIETSEGKEVLTLEADDHFAGILEYFSRAVHDRDIAGDEYAQNINQARLIHEFRIRTDE